MGNWVHVATMVSTEGTVGSGWCTPFGCLTGDMLAQAMLILGLTALAFFALAALSVIPEAKAVVREERSRAARERDAFERFARRVASLEVGPSGSPGLEAPGVGTLAVAGGEDNRLTRVRRAYRETVMDVAHYDDEYDEPLATNLGAEFGEGVATAVTGADVFTPALRQTLVESADAASERRAGLCRALDSESEALGSVGRRLRGVEETVAAADEPTLQCSFEELMDRWGDLYDAQRAVEETMQERQSDLQTGYGVAPRLDGPISLHDYLYEPEPYTHPVLAEGAAMLDAVESAQARVSTALSRRV